MEQGWGSRCPHLQHLHLFLLLHCPHWPPPANTHTFETLTTKHLWFTFWTQKLCCVRDCWMCSELRLYCINCYLNDCISLFQDFRLVLSPFYCFLVSFHKVLLIFWLAFLYIFKNLNMLLLNSLWDCFYHTKSGCIRWLWSLWKQCLRAAFPASLRTSVCKTTCLGIGPDFSGPLMSHLPAFVVASCCSPKMGCFPDLGLLHSLAIPSHRWSLSQLLSQLWGWIMMAAVLCPSCPTPSKLASRKRKLSVTAPHMIKLWPSLLGVPQICDIST